MKRRREAEAKLKGDQVFKDHQHANLTEVQRAALALEGLAGEGAVSAEERRQLRKQFKEEKKRRKRQAQERMVAKEESEESEESEPEEPEDFDEERQGVDSFEQEMRKFIGKKNDADKMNTDLYFQRSSSARIRAPSLRGVTVRSPSHSRSRAAPAGVPRRLRAPLRQRRTEGRATAIRSRRRQRATDAAAAPSGAASAAPRHRGRVVGLTHHGTAIWGPGRGTTRIKFADEQVDSRRYALRARQPEDANAHAARQPRHPRPAPSQRCRRAGTAAGLVPAGCLTASLACI